MKETREVDGGDDEAEIAGRVTSRDIGLVACAACCVYLHLTSVRIHVLSIACSTFVTVTKHRNVIRRMQHLLTTVGFTERERESRHCI